MSKAVKELEINMLRQHFQEVRDYVLLEPVKLDSSTEYEFRKTLREKQVQVKLVKNSYVRKVFGELGLQAGELSGPTLICWGSQSVKGLANAVADAVTASRKDPKAPEKLKVRTAIADGNMLSLEVAKTLPTRLEAIGEVMSALCSAGSDLASAITTPGAQLAGILKAIEEKETSPAA